MAPIPTKQKKKPENTDRPADVSTANVYDYYGRSLDRLLRKQKNVNRKQSDDITINRQHAQQYESDIKQNKLIYRDVFPGRKYKLTLSDTTWMGGDNVVRIGYTVGDTFTQLSVTASAPEDNIFNIEIPPVAAVDTLEIRLEGAGDTVRGYLEDNSSSTSLWEKIADILIDIASIKDRLDVLEPAVSALNTAVGIPYTGSDSLDDRVTDLENNP